MKIKLYRILKITNDIAEDMNFGGHTKAEYRAVINYWCDLATKKEMKVAAQISNSKIYSCIQKLTNALEKRSEPHDART